VRADRWADGWADGWAALVVALPFALGAAAAPVSEQRVVFSFADREIGEASGLALVDGLFVTVNDSGDTGRVFTVDPATGETVGVTSWDEEATDDEALAPAAEGSVWVGDIGDNLGARDDVVVRRVPVGRGDRTVDPASFTLVYPDGPRDAETLLSDPVTGRLYVASKGVLGGTLYEAPATLQPGDNVLTAVGPVLGIATDGAFLPDGRHVVLRDYGRAVVYSMPDLQVVGSFDLPPQEQGEAIAVGPDDALYVTSEGVGAEVLRVDLPADVAAAVAPSGSASPSGSPSASEPPRTTSREDVELPESTDTSRPAWPWFFSALIAVGGLAVLLRSMRRR
jgi:hypothetical protein